MIRMKTFVTGGTGFIGSHLVERLLRDGHEVRCLVRTPDKHARLVQLGALLVPGEVTDRAAIDAGMRGVDWCFHLASINTHWEKDPTIYERVHVEGTRTVLESALAAKVAMVVHCTTSLVWGKPRERPFTEQTPLGPTRFTEYARTKIKADRIALDFNRNRGLPLVLIAPGGVIGRGDVKQAGQHISRLIEGQTPVSVFGNRVTTLVYVQDVVEVMVRAAARPDCSGETFLVGAERLTTRALNELVAEVAGITAPRLSAPDALVFGASWLTTQAARLTGRLPFEGIAWDSVRTMAAGLSFDGSKAERVLGIRYTPLRTGIEEEVAAIRAQDTTNPS